MVYFIGAGPGDPELLTIKGKRIIDSADLIIYTGSLVNHEILKDAKKNAEIYNSALLNLNEIIDLISDADSMGKMVARVHTGDPSIYGAHREQMRELEKLGISYKVIPGVSSFNAAAASLNIEYTLPDVSQTIIITRMEGKTPVPEKESIESLSIHNASMVIFLSAGMIKELVQRLCVHYPVTTPAAVVYKASWDDEKILKGSLADIVKKANEAGIKKTALIIVGEILNDKFGYSKLYDKNFEHEFRKTSYVNEVKKSEVGFADSTDNKFNINNADNMDLKSDTDEKKQHIHGGNIIEISRDKISDFIDFSANINPFGINKKIKENIIRNIDLIEYYPVHINKRLAEKIALRHGVLKENIIIGNGAEDLIFRIINLFKRDIRILLTAPCFSGYKSAASAYNKNQIIYYYLDNDMNLKSDYIEYLDYNIDMAFITVPNNPTGLLPDKSLLEEIFNKSIKKNILLVVDESFLDFVIKKDGYSFAGRIKEYDKLIVLRSFTKMYAIPGVRLGYALCSSKDIIDAMLKDAPYWQVNTLAMAAGEAALEVDGSEEKIKNYAFKKNIETLNIPKPDAGEKKLKADILQKGDDSYEYRVAEYIEAERHYLAKKLRKFDFKVYDGSANYILFKISKQINLYKELLKYNIIIRKCNDFEGLDDSYYRTAVRLHEDNKNLIAALKKIMDSYN